MHTPTNCGLELVWNDSWRVARCIGIAARGGLVELAALVLEAHPAAARSERLMHVSLAALDASVVSST